ncbi:MAG: ATP-binding cassette domain-containing protein [Methanoregula sp.]
MAYTSSELIALQGIVTAYEGAEYPSLHNVSLQISSGEFVMVGGPNGAGKTTLLESINGLLPITHGSAQVCGLDVRKQGAEVRKRVGYVIQNFSFDPLTPFTVREVVMMGRYGKLGYFTRPGRQDVEIAERAMKTLGIDEFAEKPIGTLSGGQQQKVLIAQNIAKEPEILLLDEPYSNLDLSSREYISTILADQVKKGVTVVVVSHAFDGLPDHPLRVLVMNDGCITHDQSCRADELEHVVRAASHAHPCHA